MATTSLIRSVWSARLNYYLPKSLVFANLCNTEYEGDATNAATVKINTLGNITISDYSSTVASTPQAISATSIDLNVDQKKKFDFTVDDILKAQTNISLVDNLMQDAAYQMSDVIDQYIAGLYTESTNQIGDTSAVDVTGDGAAYEALVDLSTKLSESNVPNLGRWVVVTPTFLGLLQKDKRFNYNISATMNGLVSGMPVAGLNVFVSANAPIVSTNHKIIAGCNKAITFASGLKEIEYFRSHDFFADQARGLYVYGAKVIKPSAFAVLTADVTK